MTQRSARAVVYQRGDGFVYRFTVGEHLLISLHGKSEETLYALTPTGALLWERLERWATVDELAEELMRDYEVTKEQAVEDVKEFLGQLELLKTLHSREEAS